MLLSSFLVAESWQDILAQVSYSDKADLLRFFKSMLRESEGGYVLWGVKPACLEAFYEQPFVPKTNFAFPRQTYLDFDSVSKGVEVWNKLPVAHKNDLVIIAISDSNGGHREMLWINRQAFLSTVARNLILFKAVLGPGVSGEGLLEEIISGKMLSTVLNNNKILTGIILGFGVENSITGSRLEAINSNIAQKERPPLAKRAMRSGLKSVSSKIPKYFIPGAPLTDMELKPSFGFLNLSEEKQYLEQKLDVSTDVTPPHALHLPYFKCVKSSEETKALLQAYTSCRDDIIRLSESDDCLIQTLKLLVGNDPELSGLPVVPHVLIPSPEPIKSDKNASIIASVIKQNMLCKDEGYAARFVEGIQAAERANGANGLLSQNAELRTELFQFGEAIWKLMKVENLKNTQQTLDVIAKESNVHIVVPNHVYSITKSLGRGVTLSANAKDIKLKYQVEYLSETKEDPQQGIMTVEFDDLIPGVVQGLQGMRVGEVRELYIHPKYAYGDNCNFPPGVGLLVKVELISFATSNSAKNLPPHLEMEESSVEVNFEQLKQQAAYAEGYFAWSYYRQGKDLYSMEEVIRAIKDQKTDDLSEEDRSVELFRTLEERASKAAYTL